MKRFFIYDPECGCGGPAVWPLIALAGLLLVWGFTLGVKFEWRTFGMIDLAAGVAVTCLYSLTLGWMGKGYWDCRWAHEDLRESHDGEE